MSASRSGRPPQTRNSVVAEVGARLAAASDEKTRAWWEAYLKGAVPFRGVPMATIRKTIHDVWRERDVASLPRAERLTLALSLFRERYAEDKVAGVLALGEILLPELELGDVDRLAEPFARRDVDDWSTCDWYCVKALGPFVAHGADRRERAEAIATWRTAEPLWQRRAAAVAFVNYAPRGDDFFDGFVDLLLDVCVANVRDPARFSQTSVGWALRELSKAEPERVAAFVRANRAAMSNEAARAATAKLSPKLRAASTAA